MANSKKHEKNNELKLVHTRLVQLYSLLAIILIIIPEYLAELLIKINPKYINHLLPARGPLWEESFELIAVQIPLRDLRKMGCRKGISCYSRMKKEELVQKLRSHLGARSS